MKINLSFKNRLLFTSIVIVLIGIFLAWDYFHDGVPTHYILHDDNLPGFSNWWAILTIPMITWVLLHQIQKGIQKGERKDHSFIAYGFISFFLYGIALSYFFTIGSETIPGYMALGLIGASFFLPIYKAECLLGYILGMTYTFGAVLPLLFGIIFWTLFIIAYKTPRGIIKYINKKNYNSA